VTVVAVDGPSGSGKTTLALGVAAALGCPVVHLDRIFPGWDGLAAAVPLLTTQVLEPLARGERAAYRVWDWDTGRWDGTEEVPEGPLLVVEGCGASVRPAGGYAAVRVWVEAPPEERMRRGIERDGEAYRPHWERWARQEAALFEADRTRERADVTVWTGPGAAPSTRRPTPTPTPVPR
jgi:uridine kinase